MNKFIVEILNEDGTIRRSETFKNLKEISILYNISYHQVRSILNDDYKNKRNIQKQTQELITQMKIYDNPECKIKIN